MDATPEVPEMDLPDGSHVDDVENLNSDNRALDYGDLDNEYTPEVVQKIAELREAVKDAVYADDEHPYWRTDHCLHRFLVARDLNVAKAKAMYLATVQFRKDNACASTLTTYKEPVVMRRYFPWGVTSLDKHGFPILVERIGAIDLAGLHATMGQQDFLRWVIWYHEVQESVLRRATAKAGKDRHMWCCVVDMAGLSLRHLGSTTLSVLKARLRLEEDNYPEVVKRVFLVNTPGMFASVWNIVKQFVDEGTRNKIFIMGSNYKDTLLKFIDEENLPAYLGGKLVDVDGDPRCTNLVGPGGLVPPAYIVGVATDSLGMGETVQISSGKCADLFLRVPAGAKVYWRWGMTDKDVQFSVTVAPTGTDVAPEGVIDCTGLDRSICGVHMLNSDYTAPNRPDASGKSPRPQSARISTPRGTSIPGATGGTTTVVAPTKCDKHISSYTVPAGQSCIVQLRWDNSSSWVSSKTVIRRIDVLLPGDSYDDASRLRVEEDPLERMAANRAHNYNTIAQ